MGGGNLGESRPDLTLPVVPHPALPPSPVPTGEGLAERRSWRVGCRQAGAVTATRREGRVPDGNPGSSQRDSAATG